MILRHAACDLRAYRRAPLRLGGGYSLSVHWSNSSMSLRCRFSTLTARSWPGTDPMRRAGGSMRFPALVPRSPPLWSPASLIRRLSDLDGILPPGLGWCRSNIRAGARTSSAASANRAIAICGACSRQARWPSSAMPKILSGRTKDQNIGYIAEYLTAGGSDRRRSNALRRHCTYVFTTGGIGPTHGDTPILRGEGVRRADRQRSARARHPARMGEDDRRLR